MENPLKRFTRKWLIPPGIYSQISRCSRWFRPGPTPTEENALSKAGRALMNKHKGQDCFILGAGSSIKNQDLKKLAGKNVISVSNTFVHPDYHLFKPLYHALPPVMKAHGRFYDYEKFISWFKEMDDKLLDAEIVLYDGDRELVKRADVFHNRKIHWVDYVPWNGDTGIPIELGKLPDIWSVSELAVTLAVYLGFDKIYLLGFDHDWFNGPLVYFYDEKTQHKVQPDSQSLTFADSEHQMRRHAYIFSKYKYLYSLRKNIFNANANPGSYVDVFPKVNFDSLFPKADKP